MLALEKSIAQFWEKSSFHSCQVLSAPRLVGQPILFYIIDNDTSRALESMPFFCCSKRTSKTSRRGFIIYIFFFLYIYLYLGVLGFGVRFVRFVRSVSKWKLFFHRRVCLYFTFLFYNIYIIYFYIPNGNICFQMETLLHSTFPNGNFAFPNGNFVII